MFLVQRDCPSAVPRDCAPDFRCLSVALRVDRKRTAANDVNWLALYCGQEHPLSLPES